MRQQLAIDATAQNYEEALRYSDLVRDFFGLQTFSLEDLKEAIDELPADESIYLYQQFKLNMNDEDEENEEFARSIQASAKQLLYELNEKYYFLTESKIEHLQDLNAKVLLNSEYISDYSLKIEDSSLSTRVKTALTRKGITTIGDLIDYRPKDLLMIRNLGKKSIQEIEKFLDEIFD